MKTQQLKLLFVATLLLSPLARAESLPMPITEDSTSSQTGKELLGITPKQYNQNGFVGYESLNNKGVIIEFTIISPKFGGSNQVSGSFLAFVDNFRVTQRLSLQTNIDVHNPDRIGGYSVGLTNSLHLSGGTNSGSVVTISPGNYLIYGGQMFNTEVLSIGDIAKGRSTPAGLNLEITDKYASIFYNAFCPWPKINDYPLAKCVISPGGNKVYNMTYTGASIEVTP